MNGLLIHPFLPSSIQGVIGGNSNLFSCSWSVMLLIYVMDDMFNIIVSIVSNSVFNIIVAIIISIIVTNIIFNIIMDGIHPRMNDINDRYHVCLCHYIFMSFGNSCILIVFMSTIVWIFSHHVFFYLLSFLLSFLFKNHMYVSRENVVVSMGKVLVFLRNL